MFFRNLSLFKIGKNDELLGGLHQFASGKWSKIETKGASLTPRRQSKMEFYDGVLYLFGGTDQLDPGKPTFKYLRLSIPQSKEFPAFSRSAGKARLSKDQQKATLACWSPRWDSKDAMKSKKFQLREELFYM